MPVQILTSDEVIDLPLSSRPLTGLPFHALKPDEFMRLLARFKQAPTTLTGHH